MKSKYKKAFFEIHERLILGFTLSKQYIEFILKWNNQSIFIF